MTDRLATRQEEHPDILVGMLRAEEELIKRVQKSREYMFERVSVGMAGALRETVHRVYTEGNGESFTPTQARDLW